jgi:hypothetical protein
MTLSYINSRDINHNVIYICTEYEPRYIEFIELSSANIETIKKFISDSHDVYDNDHYVKKDSISIWTPQGQSPGLYWSFYSTYKNH